MSVVVKGKKGDAVMGDEETKGGNEFVIGGEEEEERGVNQENDKFFQGSVKVAV